MSKITSWVSQITLVFPIKRSLNDHKSARTYGLFIVENLSLCLLSADRSCPQTGSITLGLRKEPKLKPPFLFCLFIADNINALMRHYSMLRPNFWYQVRPNMLWILLTINFFLGHAHLGLKRPVCVTQTTQYTHLSHSIHGHFRMKNISRLL